MKGECATCFVAAVLLGFMPAAWGKVDLVTLPERASVQLTIYNSADMTLVKDSRDLTLREGINRLEFSWANTLIDPTSLEMLPKAFADKIEILGLEYPPRVGNSGVWTVRSRVSGKAPVEITYLTSGLSWRAFYMGILSADEKTMKLEGYILVANNSGEDYQNAQVRLIVGQVHILDQIAALAARPEPYGRPGLVPPAPGSRLEPDKDLAKLREQAKPAMARAAIAEPKEIVKEGLSEYFLYTIEGTETIPHGWSKRLPSFNADGVPVVNLYKYEEERWGQAVVRMLSFKNDREHKLGQTPIPGGMLRVYRVADRESHLSYEGQSSFKYIPIDEDVELNLGPVQTVLVKPTVMDFQTDRFMYDQNGNISGWDEIRQFKVEVNNTRDAPCRVEITRNIATPHWSLELKDNAQVAYEKVDLDTARFIVSLNPRSRIEFFYTLTTKHGTRAE